MPRQCIESEYFSGQGALALGLKDPVSGRLVGGLRPVGNVSALTIGLAETTLDHRESCSGQRALDRQIVTQRDVTVSFTMESFSKENLALALSGESATVPAGVVVGEAFTVPPAGMWLPLDFINAENVAVFVGGNAVDTANEDDIEIDGGGGSIMFPMGSPHPEGESGTIDYDYAAHENVEAFTVATRAVRVARFTGLNTASDNDSPVVVDIHKLQVAPLAELALINDELAQMVVQSAALSDPTQGNGRSRFFRIRKSQPSYVGGAAVPPMPDPQ